MTWAKFDDRYDDTHKIRRAWRAHMASIGLHAMAITYSARHETDGLIDVDWITDRIPHARDRQRVIDVLVDCGLFELVDDAHYRVHDYLKYNPSREQLEDKRARDAARKARGRTTMSARTPDGIHADSDGSHTTPSARPVPSRPDPTRKAGSGSPEGSGRAAGARGTTSTTTSTTGGDLTALADMVVGILQRGIDGLTGDEPCRRPSRSAVLAALRDHPTEHHVALGAATRARSIAQSQDRAPNIAALFASQLEQAEEASGV